MLTLDKLKQLPIRLQFDAILQAYGNSPLVCLVHTAIGDRYYNDTVIQEALNELYNHNQISESTLELVSYWIQDHSEDYD